MRLGNQAQRDLVSCLSRTLRQANRYLVVQLQSAGLGELSPSHGDILAMLFDQEPLTMHDLALAIQRDPSTVTALVKKLVAAGYVETGKSPDDGRVMQVRLTEKGRSLEPTFRSISDNLFRTQMQGIDQQDVEDARRTLKLIESNFAQALDGDID